jgi:hypothetical protein
MSQSDYINFKKTSLILKNNLNKLPSVLTPELYTAFTKYNLEITVPNTKNSYSRLLLGGKKNFLGIEKNVASCPTFILCKNTNTRANRVKHTIQYPTPIYKWKKTSSYKPNTCLITSGFVTRRCLCSKKSCKCKTEYYPEKIV